MRWPRSCGECQCDDADGADGADGAGDAERWRAGQLRDSGPSI